MQNFERNFPFLELQLMEEGYNFWLCVAVLSGLGTTACCFWGHAKLLEYAGVEKNTAGGGGEREEKGTDGKQHFI